MTTEQINWGGTPGPWEVLPGTYAPSSPVPIYRRGVDYDEKALAKANDPTDAIAIALVPQMVAALRDILTTCDANRNPADAIEAARPILALIGPPEDEAWKTELYEAGEIPCLDQSGHRWAISDENENVAYCSRCGCGEY